MQLKQEFCNFIKSYLLNTEFSAQALQGDAGSRIYWRIYTEKQNYILAYNPSSCSNIELFVKLTEYLRKYNFRAPNIYHQDLTGGLLLIEDFGTKSINKHLATLNSDDINKIYQLSIDLLIDLHKIPTPSFIEELSPALLLKELEVFTKYYIPYKFGRALNAEELYNFNSILERLFAAQKTTKLVLSLQDYHVDNLMFLEGATGTKSLGLLDYQDAKNGSAIYDLVSILEDARIEVPRTNAIDYLRYYATQTSSNLDDILTDYHILGLQRNCRILGVFVRKYEQGCDTYLKFLPLVEKYLSYNLSHPVTEDFKQWFVEVRNPGQ